MLNKNKLIFQDIYTFYNQAQDFAIIKEEEIIKENLNNYFKKVAINQ